MTRLPTPLAPGSDLRCCADCWHDHRPLARERRVVALLSDGRWHPADHLVALGGRKFREEILMSIVRRGRFVDERRVSGCAVRPAA